MSDRTFALVAGTGETIQLSTGNDGDYALMVGVYGIGAPPVQPRFLEGAADGGVFRGNRYGMRTMDLPIFIRGANRAEVETRIRTLARILDETNGLPKLVATYNNGEVYELPFVYMSGLEGDGSESFNNRTLYTLSVTAPDPFWTARDAQQFSASNAGTAVGLLPDLAALKVMSSVTIGSLSVTNPGDVSCPITWQIKGPGGPASAHIGAVGWTWNGLLTAGQRVDIVRSVTGISATDQSGINVYNYFLAAPKFFNLPPGDSTIDLVLTGSTSASSIAGFYRPRRKVVY